MRIGAGLLFFGIVGLAGKGTGYQSTVYALQSKAVANEARQGLQPAANVLFEATASAMAQNVMDGITNPVRLADGFIACPPLARRAGQSAPVSPAPQV